MRILILANVSMWVYKLRKEIIEQFINTNEEVYVSAISDEYSSKLEDMGCKFIDTQLDKRGTNPFNDVMLMYFYVRTIKSINPDMVLTYTIKPNIYGGIACRLAGVPYIASVTGLGSSIQNNSIIKKVVINLYKIGFKNVKCIIFQNLENKKWFIKNKIVKSKIKLVPGSGVNLEFHKYEQYPERDDEINLLFIGRIMKEKGIEELLEGAKRLKQEYNHLNFNIVGGMEHDYLNMLNEYEELGIIKYHGKQDNIHDYIKESHAIILPSYHEGIANVLLESASSGRPILASNVSGCIETFDEGVTGLGFEAKNVDSLYDTVVRFIKLPLVIKKDMGIAGRKKMEHEFDRYIVVNSYMEEIVS